MYRSHDLVGFGDCECKNAELPLSPGVAVLLTRSLLYTIMSIDIVVFIKCLSHPFPSRF
jgi:hypothetical protein